MATTLHWLAFVACNAAAAAALLPWLAGRRASAAAAEAAERRAPRWSLSLVHASLVLAAEGALEELASEGVELEAEGEEVNEAAAPELPEAFRCGGGWHSDA